VIVLVPIAFAAGVITVFTPCILPVLPIVLAGGVGKKRPYAIAAGLVTTFTAFLLAGAWLWGLLGIGKQHQIQIGAVLLGLLAITLIVPKVGEWVERPLAFMTRRRFGDAGGGFLLGAGLGLVFIPCGGPVLAALTSNVARDRVGGWLVVIATEYALGAALPMLAIAAGSRRVAVNFRRHTQAMRVASGVLMTAAVPAMDAFRMTAFPARERSAAQVVVTTTWAVAYGAGALVSGQVRAALGPPGFTANLLTLVAAYVLAIAIFALAFARQPVKSGA